MGRISPFAFLAWLDLLLIPHPSVILQRISFKRNDFRWESFLKVIWPKFSSQNSLKLCHLNTCQVSILDASRPRNATQNDEPSSGGSFNPALNPYLGLLISLVRPDCYAVQLIDCGKSVHLTVLLRVLSSAGIILDILPTNFTFKGEFLSPWLILDTQQKHQQTYPLVN